MTRTATALLITCLVLFPAHIAFPAQTTISLGELKVPAMKVTAITPQLEGPDTLRLTAELNAPPQEGCPVTWQFKGPSHGYAFESTEGASVLLFIGEEQSRVTVEACVSCGGNQGGCAEITLTADILETTQDVAAWMEIKISDFTEPQFICEHLGDDQYQYVFYEVASRVNTVTGEYYRDQEDLGVKVPGGRLAVHRWYQGGQWTWDHERHDLSVVWGPEGAITSMKKGEVTYRPVPGEESVFTDGTYRIGKTEKGFRWESRHGEWKRYNPKGRLTAFGDRTGVIGRVLFRDGHPYCLSDRNNRAVLWMEYDEAGLLRTAYDLTGRGVTYRYRKDRLSAVTDVLGKETRFAYDKEGRLQQMLEPEGEEIHLAYDAFGNVASVLDAQGKGHTFFVGLRSGRLPLLRAHRGPGRQGHRDLVQQGGPGPAGGCEPQDRTPHREAGPHPDRHRCPGPGDEEDPGQAREPDRHPLPGRLHGTHRVRTPVQPSRQKAQRKRGGDALRV